eukprot:15433067-Alexandrium_andersonii.AAC.1
MCDMVSFLVCMPNTQMHMMSDVPRAWSHSVFMALRSRAKILRDTNRALGQGSEPLGKARRPGAPGPASAQRRRRNYLPLGAGNLPQHCA